MDELRKLASRDVIARVARDFEPVRIERQLLARAFDLACESKKRAGQPTPRTSDDTAAKRQAGDAERRRVA